MKNTSYYFSHDYNARNDRKLIKLRLKLKMEGLGIYWCLVEMLYEEEGKISISDIPTIADELRVKQGIIDQVVTSFDLFQNDGNFFWSESVKRRLDKRLEKSEKAKESIRIRWQNTNVIRTNNDRNTIKGKERKEKERKVFTPPSIDEVREYFISKGYREDVAEKAFEYYDSNEWRDRNGNEVTAWKQKMVANWFKDESKILANVVPLPKKKMVL
jgi:hypothetical protein